MIRRLLFFAYITGAIISCTDETTIFETPITSNLKLESSSAILNSSISFENAGVLDIVDNTRQVEKFNQTAKTDVAGDYPLTLVAQVAVPTFLGGESLTAAHVAISGSFAYVAYNTANNDYAGGIDIINISDPNSPKVTSRLYYSNADINAIAYDNGYLYIAGGVDAETSVIATTNAFIAKIPANNGRIDITGEVVYGFQEGYNATDVQITSDKILVTSGKDGSITVYNKSDVSTRNEMPFSDLRALAVKDNTIAVLDADQGVRLLDNNLNTQKEIPITSDFGIDTKRTLAFYNNDIVVSEGSKGAGVYNQTTGDFVKHIPIALSPINVANQDIVTNAVATNQDILLMANGGAGLSLSDNKENNTNIVGVIALEGSINYVASQGDYIFAASGKQGLQIIKLNRPEESLLTRCSDLSEYTGRTNLNVNSNANIAFRGAKRFNQLNISGSLLLCGSWTTRGDVNLNNNALFEMNGTLVVGRNNNRKNINLNDGATLRIEGNLTIYGDLNLNDGATIEFIGQNSVVNIFGSVNRNGNTTVTGTYRDIKKKF